MSPGSVRVHSTRVTSTFSQRAKQSPRGGAPPTTAAGRASPRRSGTDPGGAAAASARRRASGSPVPARSPMSAAARHGRRDRRGRRTPGPRTRPPRRRTAASRQCFPVTAPRSPAGGAGRQGQFVLHAASPRRAAQPGPHTASGNDTMSSKRKDTHGPGQPQHPSCSRCRRAPDRSTPPRPWAGTLAVNDARQPIHA